MNPDLIHELLEAEVTRLREEVEELQRDIKAQYFALDATWGCLRTSPDRNRPGVRAAYERLCQALDREPQ